MAIFKELKKARSAEEVMFLYGEYVKQKIKLTTNYPYFQNNPEGFKYGNCYGYALDLDCPDIFWDKIRSMGEKGMCFDVGFISTTGSKLGIDNNNEIKLIDNFYRDCEALNLKVYDRDIEELPTNGGYNIFMFKALDMRFSHDFHFVRLNYNEVLSHREGYNDVIRSIPFIECVSSDYILIKAFEIVKPIIRERTL